MRVKTAVASLQACSVLAQRMILHAHVCMAWGALNRQNLGVWLLRGARLAEAPERTFPRLICYRALLLERQQSCSRTLHDLPQLCFGFCAQQVEVGSEESLSYAASLFPNHRLSYVLFALVTNIIVICVMQSFSKLRWRSILNRKRDHSLRLVDSKRIRSATAHTQDQYGMDILLALPFMISLGPRACTRFLHSPFHVCCERQQVALENQRSL